MLTGLPASPGVGVGRVRLVERVEDLDRVAEGEVLVAATTAPAYTPVFGRVAAVVTDRGGVLSHAAIVAREHRIPAVVGVDDATRRLRTGDRVRVDGSAGTVEVIDAV